MHETGVYSLSAEPTNMLMWSRYSDSHRGICLRFDMDVLHRHFTPRGILGLPVSYAHERPVIVVGAGEHPQELLRKLFLRKAGCWSYDEEWRFLEYRAGSGLRPFPRDALRSIILGARITDEDAQFVQALVQERGVPIEVRRAVLDEGTFELKIVD